MVAGYSQQSVLSGPSIGFLAGWVCLSPLFVAALAGVASIGVGWIGAILFTVGSAVLLWKTRTAWMESFLRMCREREELERSREMAADRAMRAEFALQQLEQDHEVELQILRRELESQQKTQQLRMTEEAAKMLGKADAARRDAEAERDRLSTECRSAKDALAECLARRQSSELRLTEWDQRLHLLAEERSVLAGDLRLARLEIQRLSDESRRSDADAVAFSNQVIRLSKELEAARLERANLELRLTQASDQAAALDFRAESAEMEAASLQRDRQSHHQLDWQRAELDRLANDNRAVEREREALKQRIQILEAAQDTVQQELARYRATISESQALIASLHQTLQTGAAEEKLDVASHFIWVVNYFRENEVLLQFENRGVPMEIIDVHTEPELLGQVESGRSVGPGATGRLKMTGPGKLPNEFVARVKFTIFPQEAAFRIRPFADQKLERL